MNRGRSLEEAQQLRRMNLSWEEEAAQAARRAAHPDWHWGALGSLRAAHNALSGGMDNDNEAAARHMRRAADQVPHGHSAHEHLAYAQLALMRKPLGTEVKTFGFGPEAAKEHLGHAEEEIVKGLPQADKPYHMHGAKHVPASSAGPTPSSGAHGPHPSPVHMHGAKHVPAGSTGPISSSGPHGPHQTPDLAVNPKSTGVDRQIETHLIRAHQHFDKASSARDAGDEATAVTHLTHAKEHTGKAYLASAGAFGPSSTLSEVHNHASEALDQAKVHGASEPEVGHHMGEASDMIAGIIKQRRQEYADDQNVDVEGSLSSI